MKKPPKIIIPDEESKPQKESLPPSHEENHEEKTIVLATDIFPRIIPILPLYERPVFPKMMNPIVITDEDSKKYIKKALKRSPQFIGLVLVKDEHNNLQTLNDQHLYQVGVVGKIIHAKFEDLDDAIQLVVQIQERFEIMEIVKRKPVIEAKVDYWHNVESNINEELKAYSISILDCIKQLIQMKPLVQEELNLLISKLNINDPGTLADFSAFMSNASREELQGVLETKKIRTRIEKVLILLKKDLEISKLQIQINKRIEDRLNDQQREFFLKEQLKEIKKELGISKDDKTSLVDKYENRVKKIKFSQEADERYNEEISALQLMEPASSEYNVIRTYLDWLTVLPWGKYSKDKYDLKRALNVLNRDHYGLEKVKERILEFISVGKIKGDLSGTIILLVGPPGVGKTSIGQSIAKSVGRKFYRFSLGGMRDEAEVKGHRRTYIGALPGKFINAIKICKTSNPIIMLDEIDKIGSSYQGDPASALLEVLDPEQNKDFLDHYLDVRFDLSKVIFICTANQIDTIPRPLLDRMEVITLSGYIAQEKYHIMKKHLIPKQLKLHGLTSKQVTISKKALLEVIDGYAREAGVRNLENQIKKILRKSTKLMVESSIEKVNIQYDDIPDLLGRRVFHEETQYQIPKIGIVTGLAYTSLGGVTLYIEATRIPSKVPEFKQTGQLGKVMVESSEIAYTYIRSILCEDKDKKKKDYFNKHAIHLHVPSGATPKDGPSAGITMATALYSLVIGKPVCDDLAMTGELTLSGLVMPIGGVKEKLLAAKRVNVNHLIFPKGNEADFEELEDYIKEGVTPYFVQNFEEVLEIAFS